MKAFVVVMRSMVGARSAAVLPTDDKSSEKPDASEVMVIVIKAAETANRPSPA